jgi:hypothetical protein
MAGKPWAAGGFDFRMIERQQTITNDVIRTRVCVSANRARARASFAWLALLVAVCFAAGCSSLNVNPPSPRPGTGYADFYCDPKEELWWDIQNLETHHSVFSEVKPAPGGLVRLALKPGRYKVAVSFLNCIILQPTTVEFEIKDGLITPIRATLAESGTATVTTKDTYRGSTVYGRYGRSTRLRASEDTVFRVNAEVQPAVPYTPKAQVPYAESFAK